MCNVSASFVIMENVVDGKEVFFKNHRAETSEPIRHTQTVHRICPDAKTKTVAVAFVAGEYVFMSNSVVVEDFDGLIDSRLQKMAMALFHDRDFFTDADFVNARMRLARIFSEIFNEPACNLNAVARAQRDEREGSLVASLQGVSKLPDFLAVVSLCDDLVFVEHVSSCACPTNDSVVVMDLTAGTQVVHRAVDCMRWETEGLFSDDDEQSADGNSDDDSRVRLRNRA